MAEWTPKSAVPVDDDWVPESARTPVKGHSRKPRGPRVGAAVGGGLAGTAARVLTAPLGPASHAAAAGAAGVGAGVGEALQQGLETVPVGMTQNPIGSAIAGLVYGGADRGEIARQASEQAAMELAGGPVAAGVKMAGRPLMQAALRVTPEVAQTAIKAGVTATKEGMDKILARIGDAGQVALNLTRRATATGLKHDAVAIEKEVFNEMTSPMRGLPGDKARRAYVDRLGKSFLSEVGMGPVTPTQLHLAKQRADALAAPLHYKSIVLKEPLSPKEDLQLVWYKNFADKARALLKSKDPVTGNELVPGYSDVNDVTSALIEVKNALGPAARKGRTFTQAALERGTLPAAGAVIGGTRGDTGQERAINAAIGGSAGVGLQTPLALSTLAIKSQHPLVAQIISNLLRIGRGASQQGEEY